MHPEALKFGIKLQQFLGTDGRVLLAGGAPRDFLMDRPIKDYDFFIEHTALRHSIIKYGAPLNGFHKEFDLEVASMDAYDSDFTVFNVGNKSCDIQLIVVNFDIKFLMNKFPIPISRAYIDFSKEPVEIYTTPGFKKAKEEQVHYIKKRDIMENPKAQQYIDKILHKYPWRIVYV